MKRPNFNWILYLALGGLALAVAILVLYNGRRQAVITETGETRRAVETTLAELLPAQVASAADPALLAAAQAAADRPYVAWVWVAGLDGVLTYHNGGPGQVGSSLAEIASRGDGPNLVAALPDNQFSPAQKLQVLAVAALRTEGEHNDVFRPLLRVIPGQDGQPGALVVVAYDASASLSAADPFAIVSILLLLAALGTYWMGLPVWVLLDARARGEPAALWGLFILFSNLAGLLAYLIIAARKVRPYVV